MARNAKNKASNGIKGKGRKRSKAEIRAHRLEVFALVMRGRTLQQAADEIGLGKTTAWRDYTAECQRRATAEDIEVRRQTILGGLDRILHKALERLDDEPQKAGESFMRAADRLIRMLGLEPEKKVAMDLKVSPTELTADEVRDIAKRLGDEV